MQATETPCMHYTRTKNVFTYMAAKLSHRRRKTTTTTTTTTTTKKKKNE